MAVEYATGRCRGARLPWKDCDRAVSQQLALKELRTNNTGVRVRCASCGTTNFIPQEDAREANEQREAIQE